MEERIPENGIVSSHVDHVLVSVRVVDGVRKRDE